MPGWWLFKKKQESVLGVDIGASALKLVAMSTAQGRDRVEGFYHVSWPCGAMEGSRIKNSQKVAALIQEVVLQGGFKTKNVVMAIPDAMVILKTITVNESLTPLEIEQLICLQASHYFPYVHHELHIDFQILGPSPTNPALLEVLLIAARTEIIRERIVALEQAGLTIKVIDVESYALSRAASFGSGLLKPWVEQEKQSIIALINLVNFTMQFVVLQAEKIIFSCTEALTLNLQPDDLILMIKRLMQLFRSRQHTEGVERILFMGDLCVLFELAGLVQEQLELPTEVATLRLPVNENAGVDQDRFEQASSALFVACGLALRRID